MKLLVILSLCLFAQDVLGGRKDDSSDDNKCELWPRPRACGRDCRYPFYKCCAAEKYDCDFCAKYGGYCEKDESYCEIKKVKKCEKVFHPECRNKYVCHDKIKPVCGYVHEDVCKSVLIDKCHKCTVKKICKKVFKCKQCKDHEAAVFNDGHKKRSHFRGRHHRNMLGCNLEKKCGFAEECIDKKFCDPSCKKFEVCKKARVYKCNRETHMDCKYVKVCDPKYKDVCTYAHKRVCKDPVKCGRVTCGKYQKCNSLCCKKVKVPKCIKA